MADGPGQPEGARAGAGRSVGPGGVHDAAHFLDGGLEAEEDGLAHDEVADVEFAHLGEARDGAHGVVGQPWPAWTSSPREWA